MYTLNATFDAHVDQEQALAAVLEVLPAGTTASLELEPVILGADDLTTEHVGASIRARVGEDDEFGGALGAVYPGENGGLLVIVDGKPRTLKWWETVQVIPPVTVGEHTPDEPEVEETEAEFDLSPDDYNNAVEIAVQTEVGLADYMLPLGWLTRVAVETVAGEEVSDDDFRIVSASVREHLNAVLDSIVSPVLAAHIAALRKVKENDND